MYLPAAGDVVANDDHSPFKISRNFHQRTKVFTEKTLMRVFLISSNNDPSVISPSFFPTVFNRFMVATAFRSKITNI